MTVRRLLEAKGNFVPFIRSDTNLGDVLDQLDIDEAGALVVTDDNLRVLGIISERDIVRGLKSKGRAILDSPVTDVMTSNVIVCDYGQPISTILELMDKHQVRHIPIMKNDQLCGIINMLDLVKYRLRELEIEANALKDYVAGRV